jgi:hypothetical protein
LAFDVPVALLTVSDTVNVNYSFAPCRHHGLAINYSRLESTVIPLPGQAYCFWRAWSPIWIRNRRLAPVALNKPAGR